MFKVLKVIQEHKDFKETEDSKEKEVYKVLKVTLEHKDFKAIKVTKVVEVIKERGAQGPQGNTGAQGFQGGRGFQGERGPQGPQGNTGAQGFQGHQGNQGKRGPQGNTGAQGFQGHQGNQGSRGFQGERGPQGYQGNTGAQGIPGTSGGLGRAGTTGAQGYQGSRGYQGYQGTAGISGAGTIIPFASGTAVTATTALDTTVATYGTVAFGASQSGLSLAGGLLSVLTGNNAFLVSRNGTITSLYASMGFIGALIVGVDATYTPVFTLYSSNASSSLSLSSFTATSATVTLPSFPSGLSVDYNGYNFANLSVPVTAGTLLVLVVSLVQTGGVGIVATAAGYVSAGLTIV